MVAARQISRFEFVIMLGDNIYGGVRPGLLRKSSSAVQAAAGRRCKVYASSATTTILTSALQALQHERGYLLHFKKGNVRFYVLDRQLHGRQAT